MITGTVQRFCGNHKRFLGISIGVILVAVLLVYSTVTLSVADLAGGSGGMIAEYRWDPDHRPVGRSIPFLASFEGNYALKINKYLEAYVELTGQQGAVNDLDLRDGMTLTAVFQASKQWPMKAALISQWGFMPGEAVYELGLTPERRVYFQVSGSGCFDRGVTELVSDESIELESPTVVTATFEPGRLALYINGRFSGEVTSGVGDSLFDSDRPVRLLERFEGILGGVWFHDRAMSEAEAVSWSVEVAGILPANAPYAQWESLGRNLVVSEPTYLGTTAGMRLYKEIDISEYGGGYLCLGDLDNDGQVDYLLYKNGSSYTVPGRLIALNHEGERMWEAGDSSLMAHANVGSAAVGEPGTTPALRGIVTIYDIDEDGRSEVITELWENNRPMLYILDGETGAVECRAESPINMSIRQPLTSLNRQPSRSHPVIRIAYLQGRDNPPSIILKYGASSGIPCHAFALDSSLNVLWHIAGGRNSMGHVPTVADIDGDGCDEIVLGHMLADNDGTVLWDRGLDFSWHADTTAVAELVPGEGKQILISVCGVGPLYCLSRDGEIIWQKTREEIAHGQAVWVGNFIADSPGLEVIALASGHVGSFVTCRGSDGTTLARFEHRKLMPAYPDFPAVVNWQGGDVQSLWIPQDRVLVDGRGEIVAELGDMDEYVQSKLHCGTSWRPVGAQAFAVDLCGDSRDELVLYEPYGGDSIFIFTQPDSDAAEKPYVHQVNTYNIRSYF